MYGVLWRQAKFIVGFISKNFFSVGEKGRGIHLPLFLDPIPVSTFLIFHIQCLMISFFESHLHIEIRIQNSFKKLTKGQHRRHYQLNYQDSNIVRASKTLKRKQRVWQFAQMFLCGRRRWQGPCHPAPLFTWSSTLHATYARSWKHLIQDVILQEIKY